MMPEPYVLLLRHRGNIEIQSFWQLCVAAVIMVPLRPFVRTSAPYVAYMIFYWLCLRLASVP